MTEIFNRPSVGSSLLKARVQQFEATETPPQMLALYEYHFMKSQKAEEKEETNVNVSPLINFDEEAKTLKDPKKTENEEEITESGGENLPSLKAKEIKKVRYAKLTDASNENSWEDIGSQTDHSDLSEGHYSDETNEERCHREHRNEVKKTKRLRRLVEINKKHGIIV